MTRSKIVDLSGWGRFPPASGPAYRPERLAELNRILRTDTKLIARGGGRSYGDQAIPADAGAALLTGRLDRSLAFDEATGEIAVEAGVTFRDLLTLLLRRGWLVPVSPGTGFATLGGAVANDVHGKNHDRDGSFGDHILWLDLLLASGEQRRITPDSDPALFAATLGGCGLTGIITALGFRMVRVPSARMLMHERRVRDLDAFLQGLIEARSTARYAVGWIDGLAGGSALGRGILELADPAPLSTATVGSDPYARPRVRQKRVPITFPDFALNRWSVMAFNALYWRRVPRAGRERLVDIGAFLYPLDALLDWNRIYGARGFQQFQCVLPDAGARDGLVRMLTAIRKAGAASFLSVLKSMGRPGRGMLSFGQPGFSLALDLPRGTASDALLRDLERMTLDAGGRIYLAKDSALSAEGFARMYPRLEEFKAVLAEVDPQQRFASRMSQRLGLTSLSTASSGEPA